MASAKRHLGFRRKTPLEQSPGVPIYPRCVTHDALGSLLPSLLCPEQPACRPPSSLARGSKAAGYTGYLPGRTDGIGKNFGKLSEKVNMKNFIPKVTTPTFLPLSHDALSSQLRLKHRYVAEPDSERSATSRDYGAGTDYAKREKANQLVPEPPSNPRGSQTDRTPFLPKLKLYDGSGNKPKPYTGYCDPSIVKNSYWQRHTSGNIDNPPSPRKTQRTANQDADMGTIPVPPKTTRQLVGISNIPQGYTGYKPRFRFCHVDPN
jgi:hypothetical protein